MPVGTAAAIGLGLGGAAIGGIAGSLGKSSNQSSTSGVNLNQASAEELKNFGLQNDSLSNIQSLIGQNGPTAKDYGAGIDSTRSFADLLSTYQQSGGLPNAGDISASNDIAKNLFAARQTSLNQSFTDQNVQEQRLSAQLGRDVNDPILQAKLRTGFMRQQDQLSAEQQGTAQQLALQLPQQRLGYAQQRTNVLNQLGGQALSNQSYLLGLGNQLGNQDRQFRAETSGRYGNVNQTSGGGLGGAISGVIGGAGAGLGAGAMLGNIGSNPFMPSQGYAQNPGFQLQAPSSNPFQQNYRLGG